MVKSKINRNIYFYKLAPEKNSKTTDLSKAFLHISALPYTLSGNYLKLPSGNYLSIHVDSHNYPLKIRFGTIRKKGLPLIEKAGSTKPLTLSRNEGLFEISHLIIFKNNVMGFESNFYGPRAGTLEFYLLARAGNHIDKCEVRSLFRKNILKMLERFGEIRLFSMNIQRDMSMHLKKLDNSLVDWFKGMEDETDVDNIEISLKSERYSKKGLNIPFLKRKKEVADWLSSEEVKPGINKFFIKGLDKITGRVIEFDLLQQFLISRKRVILQDSTHRAVNSNSAYTAIIESYNEFEDEIRELIGDQ